jgi:amino acid transporter
MAAAGMAGQILGITVMLILVTRIGQAILTFNAASRLPMVAGWDHLLPQWFTRLHPRYKTPTGSILFMGGTTLVLALMASLGVGDQEAYQLLQSGGGIAYALTYLVMFAIPVVARGEGSRASAALRMAASSGFAMTLLYVVLSVLPIVAVDNRWAFAAKVGGLVAGFNGAAALYFVRARRRAGN